MGFFSEIDIEITEMIRDGASREVVAKTFPMLREDEIDQYFDGDHDGDHDPYESLSESLEDEDDHQPSMYEEYQDLHGGDDWDHGQYGEDY